MYLVVIEIISEIYQLLRIIISTISIYYAIK